MGEEGAWVVLYTAQVTQKAKRWHDGILRQKGRNLMLYSDAKRCIDQLHAASVCEGTELKSEKHLIQVEARAGHEGLPDRSAGTAVSAPRKAIRKPKARRTLGLRSGKSRSASSPAPLPEPAPRTFAYSHSTASATAVPPRPPPTAAAAAAAAGGRRSVSFASDNGGRGRALGRERGEDGGGGDAPDERLVTFMPVGGRPVPRLHVPPGGRSPQQVLALLEEC